MDGKQINSQITNPPAAAESGLAAAGLVYGVSPETVFVWGIWAAMLAMALLFVAACGSSVPRWEEWFYIPLFTGQRQASASWLWEQAFEHRVPLFKILFAGNLKAFGLDVRPMLYLNVGLFGLLSALMIRGVRRFRGASHYADAFFPVLLLNLGHGDGFLWAQSNPYILGTFFVGVILTVLLSSGSRFTVSSATIVGTCLVLLTLCYGGGLIYAFGLAVWIGGRGIEQLRSADDRPHRRGGAIAVAAAALTAAMTVLYFVGYKPVKFDASSTSTPPSIPRFLGTTLQFLTTGLGPAAKPPVWPFSGAVVLVLLLCGALCAVRLWLARRSESTAGRLRALGIAWWILACLGVAVVTGWSRMSWGEDYLFNTRYVSAAVPFLIGLYCLFEVGARVKARSFARMALFTMVCGFMMLNLRNGCEEAASQHQAAKAFERDVKAGMSVPQLVSRHALITYYYHDQLAGYLHLLRDAGYGDYKNIPADPVFDVLSIPLSPSSQEQMVWAAPAGRVTGETALIGFDLKEPTYVCGLRIKYSSRNREGLNPYFRVDWRLSGSQDFNDKRTYKHLMLPADGAEVDVPIWIYGTLDQFRIQPDKRPCDFTISSIELLTNPRPAVMAARP